MKERPILMSGEMVRALLDGRKTQTRRVVKHAVPWAERFEPAPYKGYGVAPGWIQMTADETRQVGVGACPYGERGDRLWVKETFRNRDEQIEFRAGGTLEPTPIEINTGFVPESDNWRPSIFMPRWASRITLEIISVRVERLNAISVEDAISEGISIGPVMPAVRAKLAVHAYRSLWETINGAGSWALNPHVWAISFRRISP